MGAWVQSEPPEDSETRSDEATLRVMRGRGFALTLGSHFAIAVITAVVGFVWHSQHSQTPDVSEDVRHMKEDIAGLKSDFSQFKAQAALQEQLTERQLNELLARTAK